jgi:hypothetical protein
MAPIISDAPTQQLPAADTRGWTVVGTPATGKQPAAQNHVADAGNPPATGAPASGQLAENRPTGGSKRKKGDSGTPLPADTRKSAHKPTRKPAFSDVFVVRSASCIAAFQRMNAAASHLTFELWCCNDMHPQWDSLTPAIIQAPLHRALENVLLVGGGPIDLPGTFAEQASLGTQFTVQSCQPRPRQRGISYSVRVAVPASMRPALELALLSSGAHFSVVLADGAQPAHVRLVWPRGAAPLDGQPGHPLELVEFSFSTTATSAEDIQDGHAALLADMFSHERAEGAPNFGRYVFIGITEGPDSSHDLMPGAAVRVTAMSAGLKAMYSNFGLALPERLYVPAAHYPAPGTLVALVRGASVPLPSAARAGGINVRVENTQDVEVSLHRLARLRARPASGTVDRGHGIRGWERTPQNTTDKTLNGSGALASPTTAPPGVTAALPPAVPGQPGSSTVSSPVAAQAGVTHGLRAPVIPTQVVTAVPSAQYTHTAPSVAAHGTPTLTPAGAAPVDVAAIVAPIADQVDVAAIVNPITAANQLRYADIGDDYGEPDQSEGEPDVPEDTTMSDPTALGCLGVRVAEDQRTPDAAKKLKPSQGTPDPTG